MDLTFSEQMNRSAAEALADFVNLSSTNFSFTIILENTIKFQIKNVFSKISRSTASKRRSTNKILSLSPIMSKEVSPIYLKICATKMLHGSSNLAKIPTEDLESQFKTEEKTSLKLSNS